MSRLDAPGAGLATRTFALSRPEAVTSAVALAASSAAFALGHHPYLARGVVGDLAGLLLLGVAATVLRARVRHEALLCLSAIGVVLLVDPQWPLRIPDVAWWTAVAAAIGMYLVVRKRVCD